MLDQPKQIGILAGLLTATLFGCSAVGPGRVRPQAARNAATRPAIAAADVAARIAVLAHDSMTGREAGAPGIDLAVRYLSGELARLGLTPAGDDGTFLQAVPLERKVRPYQVSVSTPAGLQLGPEDLVPGSGIAGLPDASRSFGRGPLVFAGHLIDTEVHGSDELALSQLRDAAVIIRLSPAPGADPERNPARAALQMLLSPSSPAMAILLVAEGDDAAIWEYAVETGRKGSLSLGSTNPASTPLRVPPIFFLSTRGLESLLGVPLDSARTPRSGLGTFEFSVGEVIEPVTSHNLVAIVPGSDPARAGEYVALGAHYDHVGAGTAVAGDSIYNGADDNASGTAALMEVAEALAALPPNRRPARSTLLVFHTAEESGMLGSQFFTDHPPVDHASIVGHVNLDMVGRNHPDSLFTVGSRRLSTEFGDVVDAVNRRQARPFILDPTFDAPNHPEAIYCRSDHYNYARYGIPILFLTTGLHDDYHAPSDEAHLIDGDKAARVARLVYDLAVELGNRPVRLRVDRPAPPSGASCT